MLEKLEYLPDHLLEVQAEEEKGDVDRYFALLMNCTFDCLESI